MGFNGCFRGVLIGVFVIIKLEKSCSPSVGDIRPDNRRRNNTGTMYNSTLYSLLKGHQSHSGNIRPDRVLFDTNGAKRLVKVAESEPRENGSFFSGD